MSITLYQMPHSPYCIPITQALAAVGAPFDTVDISPATRAEVIVASGGRYYQVPLLVDDGRAIMESASDSLDIAHHIDRKYANGRLFPAAAEAANVALTRFIENDLEGAGFKLGDPFYIDSLEDTATRVLVVRHKERKFGIGCIEAWRERHDELAAEFDLLLESFDRTLRHQPFLLGGSPVYADFALFGVLGNVTFNGWNSLNPERSGISAWRARLESFRY